MQSEYLATLGSVDVPFTATDLVEGLEFLDPPVRRAVVFGLDQDVSCNDVIEMTHARLAALDLQPLALAAVKESPRHIRLHYVFWVEQGSLVTPILDLDMQIKGAFGGMDYLDLQLAYKRMIWVDHSADAEDFIRLAREHGVL